MVWWLVEEKEKYRQTDGTTQTCLINTDIYSAAVATLVEIIAIHCIVLDENGRNKWNCQSYKPFHLH